MLPPVPPNYVPQQGYLRPASSAPTGINADYAWTLPGGDGRGVTVCDAEYGWYTLSADNPQLPGAELNTNIALPLGATDDHGTAVVGELCSDPNGWGTTGICYGATLKTCGTFYGTPTPVWNVPGAIAIATAAMGPGDVLLLSPGTYVAADARILNSHRLSIDESALTGESLPEDVQNLVAARSAGREVLTQRRRLLGHPADAEPEHHPIVREEGGGGRRAASCLTGTPSPIRARFPSSDAQEPGVSINWGNI